ncbi:MAG: hypothetical protein ACXADC_08770 [Candidatus Thorarchaeota archaeon]|jgi:hypothetical protein
MSIRPFPRTREEPRKRILAIPFVLIFLGMAMNVIHPALRFLGTVIAFAGVLTVFLVGMVFADLWASARRTKDIIKAREARMTESDDPETAMLPPEDDLVGPDPFEEAFGDEE